MSQQGETGGQPQAKHGENSRYLSFSLGAEEYAIPLLGVREVIGVPDITPIPFSAPHFLGIMNLRGQVITIIDLRIKMGIKPVQGQETAVIICDLAPLCIGVIVDSINSVISPAAEDLAGKPDVRGTKGAEYILDVCRQEDSLVLLIDVAKALGLSDLRAAAVSAGKPAA